MNDRTPGTHIDALAARDLDAPPSAARGFGPKRSGSGVLGNDVRSIGSQSVPGSGMTNSDWRELFRASSTAVSSPPMRLHVARQQGGDWLVLPMDPKLAVQSMALYPAQTAKARWARRALGLALRLGLKPGLSDITLAISTEDPFVDFLRQTAATPSTSPLQFSLLAGHPNAPGSRYVLLLFGADGRPVVVVKAGVSASARQLVAAEEDFLRRVPSPTVAIPKLRGVFQNDRVRALALDFFPGDSPVAHETRQLGQLLTDWLREDCWRTLGELAGWQRLRAGEKSRELAALDDLRVRPTIYHGDLTPWNIKSSASRWTVLDWESGESQGVPAWDWFHFVIQPALLVQQENVSSLFQRFENLLASPEFRNYASRAGIVEHSRLLAIGYLLNCLNVTRQTVGAERLRELGELMRSRWSSRAP